MPVLILTARDAWHEKVEGFNAGADDYVAKPFHVEELYARLGALIRRAHAQPAGMVTADGLRLDEARQVVVSGDRTIALSGVEFRLLRYFMLHPGQVLSKSHLAEHVYDNDSDRDSNVIEVHVNHLRNKLGAGAHHDPARPGLRVRSAALMRSLLAPLVIGLVLSLAAVFGVQWSVVRVAIDA